MKIKNYFNYKLLIKYFWHKLFLLCVRKLCTRSSRCSARFTREYETQNHKIIIGFVDKTEENHYERTELYRILRVIRKEENYQHWKVPEPTEEEIEKSEISKDYILIY